MKISSIFKKDNSPQQVKKGITKRLFLYFISVVLGITGLILLSNTLLLRPLYYQSIKSEMLDAMEKLSEIDYNTESLDWTDELGSITTGKAFDVVIRSEGDVLYSSSVEVGLRPNPEFATGSGIPGGSDHYDDGPIPTDPSGSDDPAFPSDPQTFFDDDNRFFMSGNTDDFEQIGDGVYISKTAWMSNISFMICTKDLADGTSIFLTQPIEPVNQSVSQANILLIGCAILATGLSLVFALVLSRRFTKPIRQIQNYVGSLAALDFSGKSDIRTGDELQSLGEDINSLGDKLKGALDTLRTQNDQLEKDIIAQRQFISNASHELRTPLSLIKGYADEMNSGYVKESGQKEAYIKIISEEAAKMNRLLREMLELARMESGMARLQMEALSVGETIKTFLEKYDGFITENRLNIKLDIGNDEVGFFDPVRFEQVLANYISNASRYGDDQKRVKISVKSLRDCIRITVFNTGTGVPEDIKESIWDGFYKANTARTRTDDSYGLGLSVVKVIQDAANQRFGMENVPDGVEFWFEVARG